MKFPVNRLICSAVYLFIDSIKFHRQGSVSLLQRYHHFSLIITMQVSAASLSSSQVENNIYFYIKFDLDLTTLKTPRKKKTYFSHAEFFWFGEKLSSILFKAIEFTVFNILLAETSILQVFSKCGCVCFTSQTRVFHPSS